MAKQWQLVSVSLVLVLVLAAMPAVAWGEMSPSNPAGALQLDENVLVYDEPVEGTINSRAFTQEWTLQSQAADRIRVRVERLDGNLIPEVSIQDFTGNVLSRSNADETRAVATLFNYKLPSAGEYQIVVGRDRGEGGETTGAYRLTVELLGSGADHPDNAAIVGVLTVDTPTRGEITAGHWQHVYTLNGEAGDLVQTIVSREGGTLIAKVELQDSNGQALSTGNPDQVGVRTAHNPYELRADGQYRVLVFRDRGVDGDTVGEYEVTVRLLGSGENSSRMAVPPNVVDEFGEALQGTITNEHWYEDWQFTATAADLFTITVMRTPEAGNTFIPQVFLLGGAGQELRRGNNDTTGTYASIDRYKLAAPGTYVVRVMRDRGKPGMTTGNYELSINMVGSGMGSPALAESSGTIQTRVPIEGEITHVRWADTWTYSGQAGDVVDITVTRSDGTLAPRVEILDANRQSLRSAQVSVTADTSILAKYQIPTTAEYYIVVSRDRGQDGMTTGSYSLVITPSE